MREDRIPRDWIEVREWPDPQIGGMRYVATVRFAVGTRVERERLQDAGDEVAQAALLDRVMRALVDELNQRLLLHHVPTGGVVESLDVGHLLGIHSYVAPKTTAEKR